MVRSLGLTAYQALARRGEPPKVPHRPLRPVGELVWIHAAERDNLIAVFDLAARLCASRDGLNVLITQPTEAPQAPRDAFPDEWEILFDALPSDHPDSVTDFLDHWAPDTCLWIWGALRPNLILKSASRGCPMILLDADAKGFDGRRDRWLPDLTSHLLKHFSHVHVRSEAGRRRLKKIGFDPGKITITSPLVAGGRALPCSDSDLSDLSEAIGGRPAWFAACLAEQEIGVVLDAHRQALRHSHRLLLILNTANPDDAEEAKKYAADARLALVNWSNGQEPDETTQVMIADDVADRGLFFRLAPVSFLGGSLVPDSRGCDPFEAAALGSAVLYGPRVGRFISSYSRLAAAGAARIVNDAAALGNAVSRLIAPDQAATMAHAGWDVISRGAELTDRITDLVQDALDARERGR